MTALPDQMLVSAFLENLPDHVYFKDQESRFLSVSLSLARSFGCSTEEVVGKTDFDFFDESQARPYREAELKIMRTGEPIIDRVVQHTWPDGHVTWSLNVALPMRDDGGKIVGIFGTNKDITAAKLTEQALEKANRDLLEMSRMAGMAEAATAVLHNVGNVLNSVNVSTTLLAEGLRKLKVDRLALVSGLLREHVHELTEFVGHHSQGRHVLEFLDALHIDLSTNQAELLSEVGSLERGVAHIKEIVNIQQSYATMKGLIEDIEVEAVVEDALKMSYNAFLRHGVGVQRDFQSVPKVTGERGKILQILHNLLRNAKYALDEASVIDKRLEIRIEPGLRGMVRVVVKDNGVGILPGNLTRIFAQGFTTRKDGHGFGLHSAANAAQAMRGSLTAHSEGPGKGALFILELPMTAQRVS